MRLTPALRVSPALIRTSAAFTIHRSFREIASLYDGVIVDQYGVMHDGKHALPGAVECLQYLASKGKKIVVLSNTSSTSRSALERLPELGFDKDLFVGVVTSGDEAAKFISSTYGRSRPDQPKKKGLWFTWKDGKTPSPREFLEMCGEIEATDSADDADFVIVHGAEVVRRDNGQDDGEVMESSIGNFVEREDYSVIDPILKRCKERSLTMIVGNPDLIVMMGDGTIGHMPGKIGERYERFGGKCIYFGKPYTAHFESCLKKLRLNKDRVVHIGDSLQHDVKGANDAGIASVFITGGIHSADLGTVFGELPDRQLLHELIELEGPVPTHVIPTLAI